MIFNTKIVKEIKTLVSILDSKSNLAVLNECDGNTSVNLIVEKLNDSGLSLSQSEVSQRLAILLDSDLVFKRKVGKRVFVTKNDTRINSINQFMLSINRGDSLDCMQIELKENLFIQVFGQKGFPPVSGVYVFLNDEEYPLYIGSTSSLRYRLDSGHEKLHHINRSYRNVTIAYRAMENPRTLEKKLIEHFKPVYNVHRNSENNGKTRLEKTGYADSRVNN